MKKKSLALFLAFCLTMGHGTAAYAAFWSNWNNWIQVPTMDSVANLVDKETAKKLFPIAILAAVIGFYYWMSKKNGGDDAAKEIPSVPFSRPLAQAVQVIIPEQPANIPQAGVVTTQIGEKTSISTPAVATEMLTSIEPAVVQSVVVATDQPTLEQFSVYPQSRPDGGGAASCGYQTLLRGMQLISALSKNESIDAIKRALTDSDVIEWYFGTPDSDWRKQIIIKRQQNALKNELHARFIPALAPNADEKVKGLYKSVFGNLEDMIKNFVNEYQSGQETIDFSDQAIKEYIRIGLDKLKNAENLGLISDLERSSIIMANINFDEIRNNILAKDSVFRIADLMKEVLKKPSLQSDLSGEWLGDGEVEYLWEYENNKRDSIIPMSTRCGFKAIPNFDFIGMEDFDEVTPYVQESVRPKLQDKSHYFQLFALGTMRQDGDQHGSRGHWYPLVMQKKADGTRKYYIMDSMGTNRTKDVNAWKIISLIENK